MSAEEAVARARAFALLLLIAEDENEDTEERVSACHVILSNTSSIDVEVELEPVEA